MHARPSGSSAFRFTLPGEQVREVFIKHGLTDDPLAANMNLYLSMDGTERTAVTYPCGAGKLLNFAFVVPDALLGRETVESWTAEAQDGEIRRLFHDFHPAWLELADMGHQRHARCWRLRQQDAIPTYTRGVTFLVGDAAHAMTPHLGQGCTQAIEDAAAFELFNDSAFAQHTVSEILVMIDSVRRRRASKIQMWTREYQTWKKTALDPKYTWYCWSYPGGIKGCLERLARGEEMIDLSKWEDRSVLVSNGQGKRLSTLEHVPEAPPDPLFGMKKIYQADQHPRKTTLMVGAYKDDSGKLWRLPSVEEVRHAPFDLGSTLIAL